MKLSSLLKAGAILSLIAVILISSHSIFKRTQSRTFDLDGDLDEETITLNSGLLKVFSDNQVIYNSDIAWEVTLFEEGDVNNDAKPELLVGFWRYGDYGPENEYARIRRDPKRSYHLYLYQYDRNAPNLRLIWGSSTLNDPIFSMEIQSIDEKNYLKLETGTYSEYDETGNISVRAESLWLWEDWYFSKLHDY